MESTGASGSEDLDVHALLRHVRAEFAVSTTTADLVSGEDEKAVVLRGVATDQSVFALEASREDLSRGALVSAHLAGRGIDAVPAPLPARSGRPWSRLDTYQVTVTPWVSGRSAATGGMGRSRWRSFGALLAQVHAAVVPADLRVRLPADDFVTPAAAAVRSLPSRMRARPTGPSTDRDDDSLVRALTRQWIEVSDPAMVIVEATEALGSELRGRPAELVLTHGDTHLHNVVIADHAPTMSLIDWGGTAFAPRERDLMFVVGGVLTGAPVTAEEQTSFFEGYGRVDIDPACLTYYRCSWAVQDIASYAAQTLDESSPQPRREHVLRLFTDLFEPTGIVATALESLRCFGRRGQ